MLNGDYGFTRLIFSFLVVLGAVTNRTYRVGDRLDISKGDFQMKKMLFSIFWMLLIVTTFCLPYTFAQDYTQWELPEGTIARLGKGRINDMQYSSDGTVLAIATTIGTWIYDTDTYQERALLSHDNKGVEKILFSPEGTTLACAGSHRGITLWDVGTRKLKKTFRNSSSIYRTMLFSPDGRTFASGHYKEIHLWDTVTGESKHILKEHTDFLTSLSFSPDGQTLASGSKDQTICLWDVATGTHKQTLTGHLGSVDNISFSPDGSTFVTVGDDKTIYLWDTTTGKRKKTLADQGLITEQIEQQETFERMFFSPYGGTLVTVRFDNTIRLWDTTTGALKQTFTSQDTNIKQTDRLKQIKKVLFSLDNRTIVSIIEDGKIRLWDVASGKRKHLSEYPGYVRNVSITSDGKILATGIFGGIIRIWDVATGKHIKTVTNLSARYYEPYAPNNISLSPNGEKCALGNSDGTIYLWDKATKQQQTLSKQILNNQGLLFSNVLFSPDGITLASWGLGEYKTIRLWDVATGKQKRTLKGYKGYIKRVTFSPDGNRLACWGLGKDNTIRLWDVATGKHKRTFKGYTELVEVVSFNANGQTLVSGGLNGTLRLWDVVSGKQLHTFTNQRLSNNQAAQSAAATVVSFNSDGTVLASGRKNGSIHLWDVVTGQLMQTLRGHADAISSVSFSPNGLTIVSTGKDATVRLWDVATGEQKQTLAGYKRTVWHVFFYPNGLLLAIESRDNISGSGSEKIHLWDLRTGQLKKTLTGHTSWVTDISFSADGKTLSSLSFDGTVLLWDLTPILETLDVAE